MCYYTANLLDNNNGIIISGSTLTIESTRFGYDFDNYYNNDNFEISFTDDCKLSESQKNEFIDDFNIDSLDSIIEDHMQTNDGLKDFYLDRLENDSDFKNKFQSSYNQAVRGSEVEEFKDDMINSELMSSEIFDKFVNIENDYQIIPNEFVNYNSSYGRNDLHILKFKEGDYGYATQCFENDDNQVEKIIVKDRNFSYDELQELIINNSQDKFAADNDLKSEVFLSKVFSGDLVYPEKNVKKSRSRMRR